MRSLRVNIHATKKEKMQTQLRRKSCDGSSIASTRKSGTIEDEPHGTWNTEHGNTEQGLLLWFHFQWAPRDREAGFKKCIFGRIGRSAPILSEVTNSQQVIMRIEGVNRIMIGRSERFVCAEYAYCTEGIRWEKIKCLFLHTSGRKGMNFIYCERDQLVFDPLSSLLRRAS